MSATALGATAAEAKTRHDAERTERLVLLAAGKTAGSEADRRHLSGSAAGQDSVKAITRRALCEMVERRACLLWWSGSLDAHSPSLEARETFDHAKSRWPRVHVRKTGLVQLALGALPPVCVSWSCDERGMSLCFGTACASSSADAAQDALKELYQMEFGLDVIRHKARHGAALSPFERRMLARASTLREGDLDALLRPSQPRGRPDGPDRDLEAALSAHGLDPRVTIFEGFFKVVHVRFNLQDVGPAPPTPWSLYGTHHA